MFRVLVIIIVGMIVRLLRLLVRLMVLLLLIMMKYVSKMKMIGLRVRDICLMKGMYRDVFWGIDELKNRVIVVLVLMIDC